MASDKVFAGLLQRIANSFTFDFFVIALTAWISAGWLSAATADVLGATVQAPTSPRLKFATIAVPLCSLIALLTLFLVTQMRVLFGGAEFLQQTEGLTIANYARDGFFQLILAASIVQAVRAENWYAAGAAVQCTAP